jgi:hypothetical protein
LKAAFLAQKKVEKRPGFFEKLRPFFEKFLHFNVKFRKFFGFYFLKNNVNLRQSIQTNALSSDSSQSYANTFKLATYEMNSFRPAKSAKVCQSVPSPSPLTIGGHL